MQLRYTQFSEKLNERRQAMVDKVDKIIMLLIAFDLLLVALKLLVKS